MLVHNLYDHLLLQAHRRTPLDPRRRVRIIPENTGYPHSRHECCIVQGYSSRLQCYVGTSRTQGMVPFESALGLCRKPAKMVLRADAVIYNVGETAQCHENSP